MFGVLQTLRGEHLSRCIGRLAGKVSIRAALHHKQLCCIAQCYLIVLKPDKFTASLQCCGFI